MQKKESSASGAANYILDSYAILAYLEAEQGSSRVKTLLETADAGGCRLYMSVVNLGEVAYIVERERGLPRAQETLAYIDELPIEIIDANRAITLAAAHLKANCPVAYADCFAAALAQDKQAALVTGDPEFSKIEANTGLNIEWLVNKQ
jgi:ribonuclease VapC